MLRAAHHLDPLDVEEGELARTWRRIVDVRSGGLRIRLSPSIHWRKSHPRCHTGAIDHKA